MLDKNIQKEVQIYNPMDDVDRIKEDCIDPNSPTAEMHPSRKEKIERYKNFITSLPDDSEIWVNPLSGQSVVIYNLNTGQVIETMSDPSQSFNGKLVRDGHTENAIILVNKNGSSCTYLFFDFIDELFEISNIELPDIIPDQMEWYLSIEDDYHDNP